MKIVADYPAYMIVDMEQDIIEWPDNDQRMATVYHSRSHGVMYNLNYLGGIAEYARRNGDDVDAALARAAERKEKLFWLNQSCVSISNTQSAKETHILCQDGQKIRFDGQLLVVKHVGHDRYTVEMISE